MAQRAGEEGLAKGSWWGGGGWRPRGLGGVGLRASTHREAAIARAVPGRLRLGSARLLRVGAQGLLAAISAPTCPPKVKGSQPAGRRGCLAPPGGPARCPLSPNPPEKRRWERKRQGLGRGVQRPRPKKGAGPAAARSPSPKPPIPCPLAGDALSSQEARAPQGCGGLTGSGCPLPISSSYPRLPGPCSRSPCPAMTSHPLASPPQDSEVMAEAEGRGRSLDSCPVPSPVLGPGA